MDSVPPLLPCDSRPRLKVLYVGRLSPEKNPSAVFRVAELLQTHGITTDVHVIGDGPLRSVLEREANRIDCKVSFSGWVSDRKRLLELIRQADYLLLPSFTEGSPKVLLESMAMGTVVATWRLNQSVVEVTQNGGAAIMADGPEDFSGWANQIAAIHATPTYEKMRIAAWERAKLHTVSVLHREINVAMAPFL